MAPFSTSNSTETTAGKRVATPINSSRPRATSKADGPIATSGISGSSSRARGIHPAGRQPHSGQAQSGERASDPNPHDGEDTDKWPTQPGQCREQARCLPDQIPFGHGVRGPLR